MPTHAVRNHQHEAAFSPLYRGTILVILAVAEQADISCFEAQFVPRPSARLFARPKRAIRKYKRAAASRHGITVNDPAHDRFFAYRARCALGFARLGAAFGQPPISGGRAAPSRRA